MLGGAKLGKNFVPALLVLSILLASCVSEPGATATAANHTTPAATELSAALNTESLLEATRIVPVSQTTETRLPAATQVSPTVASQTGTATQLLPIETATLPPTTSRTLPATQLVPQLPTPTPLPSATALGDPEVVSFTVSPEVISPGESVTVTWETKDGEHATFCSVKNRQQETRICLDLPLVGTHVVHTESDATIYDFSLAIANPSAAAPVHSRIVCAEVSRLFFEDPAQACGGAPPLYSYAAAQRFEHGLMIWMEATDEYFIFVDNPNHETYIHILGPLELKPGASVDNRVGDVPPGYYEPVSGFGLVWRGEVEWSSEWTRENLGWALEPEVGFETVFQRGTYHGATWDAYIRDADGRAIWFFRVPMAGHFWKYVQ